MDPRPTKFWMEASHAELKDALTAARYLGLKAGTAKSRKKRVASVLRILPGHIRGWVHKPKVMLQLSFVGRALEEAPWNGPHECFAFVGRRAAPQPVPSGWLKKWVPASGSRPLLDVLPRIGGVVSAPSATRRTMRRVDKDRGGGKAAELAQMRAQGVKGGGKVGSRAYMALTPSNPLRPESFAIRANSVAESLVMPPAKLAQQVRNDLLVVSQVVLQEAPEAVGTVFPISELGGKTRVATIHSIEDTVRGDLAGDQLRSLMRKHPALVDSLEGDPVEFTLKPSSLGLRRTVSRRRIPELGWLAARELYVFSSDLRAATDLISHDVLYALCDRTGIPIASMASAQVEYCGIHVPVKRGTCLGLGGSWPALSLIHAYAADEIGLPNTSYRIKGDDLVGLWTGRQIRAFAYWLPRLTGMELQLSKTFISRTCALYCERAFRCDVRTGRFVRMPHSLSLKTIGAQLKLDEHQRPQVFGLCGSLHAEVSRESRRRVRLVMLANPLLRELESAHGRWCYIPSVIGGLDMVPPRRHLGVPPAIGAFVRAVANGGLIPPSPLPPAGGGHKDSIHGVVSRYLSRFFPRRLALLPDDSIVSSKPIASWFEASHGHENDPGYFILMRENGVRLQEQRTDAMQSMTYAAAASGLRHIEPSRESLRAYFRLLKKAAKRLSTEHLPRLDFGSARTLLMDRTVWIPNIRRKVPGQRRISS